MKNVGVVLILVAIFAAVLLTSVVQKNLSPDIFIQDTQTGKQPITGGVVLEPGFTKLKISEIGEALEQSTGNLGIVGGKQ